MSNSNKLDLRKWIVQHPNVLLDENHLRAILSDAFKNDSANINLMLTAFKENVVWSLRQSFPWNPLERSRYIKILEQRHSIVNDRAVWAVNTWASLFSDRVIDALNQYEKDVRAGNVRITDSSVLDSNPVDDSNKVVNELHIRNEYDDFYVNPSLIERADRIYIPCGLGNTDNGFFIYGIKKAKTCLHRHASVYALVYNLLIRSSTITRDNIPKFLKNVQSAHEIDYRSIFRIAITLLQMVKNNYAGSGNLNIAFFGHRESLKYAINLINHYAALFGRLTNIGEVKLSVHSNQSGSRFCLEGKEGIYVRNNTELITNARELWYARKIIYNFSKKSLPDLEYLLREISPFDHFLEGQFEALKQMISVKEHMVCIMPTGSGKSLIYYMISLLQPLPIMVISPTDILIQDQIRNLKQIHQIENVAHLQLTSENNFVNYEIHNSLNYLTPTTLQNRNLLAIFKQINNSELMKRYQFNENGESLVLEEIPTRQLLSNIVLDEVHCISNWGHDFRPEYLMLSRNLNKYSDLITLLGFTATANYTVIEDVQKQLKIQNDNILSPVAYEKYNISYQYRCLDSTQDMLTEVKNICETLITQHERTIIFTKSDEMSRNVANVVGYEADIFTVDDPEAYHHFVDGKCLILITSEELGVGINFPNIKNIIHFGLPLSKSNYVQEVGRAGRANEQVSSYVLYLNSQKGVTPRDLLRRQTPIENIPDLLVGLDNDYGDIYRQITNNCPTKEFLINQLLIIYHSYSDHGSPLFIEENNNDELYRLKQKLFMLYSTGFIHDFYALRKRKSGVGIEIIFDVNSTEDPKKRLRKMRNRLSTYLEEMGSGREIIARVRRADSEEEIIKIYVDWYYNKYLYHHNEQFLDLFDFIEHNSLNNDSEIITSTIKDYFNLPFIKLKSDEEKFVDMSIQQIGDKVVAGIDTREIANIERINSNRYSYKLDYFLFCANLRFRDVFETDRLQRILGNVSDQDEKVIVNTFRKLYKVCSIYGKLSILKYFELFSNRHQISFSQFFSELYTDGSKDIVYFGLLAKKLNPLFFKTGGNNIV